MNKNWTPRIFCSYLLTEYGVIFYGKKDHDSSRQSGAEIPPEQKPPDAGNSGWMSVCDGAGCGTDGVAGTGDVCRTDPDLGNEGNRSAAGLCPCGGGSFFLCQMLGAERLLSGAVVCSDSVFRLLFDFPELGRDPVLARAGQAVFHADLRLCVREPRRQSPFGKTGLKKAGAKIAPAFLVEKIILL